MATVPESSWREGTIRTFNLENNIVLMFKSRRILFVLMLVVCLSLMAFAWTDSEDDEDMDSDTFAKFLVAAETAATAVNLSLSDFPIGWTSGAASEEDEDDSDLDLSEDCRILDLDTVPGEVFEADSDDFTGPDGQSVSSSATVLISSYATENAIEAFLKASSF